MPIFSASSLSWFKTISSSKECAVCLFKVDFLLLGAGAVDNDNDLFYFAYHPTMIALFQLSIIFIPQP